MNEKDTIVQRLRRNVAEHPDWKMLLCKNRQGEFEPVTFGEFYTEVKALAAALNKRGFKRGDHAGIISDNRKEWLMSDIALLGLGGIDVPRGSDATGFEVGYILEHGDCTICFAENRKQAEKILAQKDKIGKLQTLILYDDAEREKVAAPAGMEILGFKQLLEEGRPLRDKDPAFFDSEVSRGSQDDLASLLYTSGTTGNPKGVMLTHRSFMFQIDRVQDHLHLGEQEIFLTVLPIWHSFERAVNYIAVLHRMTLAYSKPIGAIMLPDMAALKPHWMTSVPRIWESVRAGILRNIKKSKKGVQDLFYFFLSVGEIQTYLLDMFRGNIPQFSKRMRGVDIVLSLPGLALFTPLKKLGDILVFRKIRLKLGGRFVAGVSGGGALPPYVDKFFKAVGITVLEGYGLTETGPILSVRKRFKPVPSTVGPLLKDIEYRVIGKDGSLKDIGYKGELHVKSPQIMEGYYKDPEKTAEVLKEGWLNTGDLAVFTHSGDFAILGRSKETIVLRGGENIEPVPIEEKLNQSEHIEQAMVVGQDEKFLGALIYPNLDAIEQVAMEQKIEYFEREDLLTNPHIKEFLHEEIQGLISNKNGFKNHEHIYRFHLLMKPFEVGQELTTTLKIRRNVVTKLYRHEIKELFR